MNYLDFDIELRKYDDRQYQVIVHAPDGATMSEIVAPPFTDAELENYLLHLENAILRSVGRRRKPQTEEEGLLQTFGQHLFDFLLKGEARSLYYESQHLLRYQQGLRLRLHIHSPELALLPWEFLYDPRRGDYVCLDPYTPMVRYPDLPQRVQPLSVTLPLQILGMVASPSNLQRLDVTAEQANVERALHDLQARGMVKLTWLPGDTAQELQRFMRTNAGPWHIFHFIGHGGFDATYGEGLLYLADEQQHSHAIGATQLSRLLAGQRYALRLVVLNACEGARGGREDVFSSMAATLVRGGLPAVLAMQYDITDGAAVAFAQSFYEAIADGLPVDTAVSDARNAVSLANEHSLEWGTPVLYMRSPDGQLFAVEGGNQTSSKPAKEPVHPTQKPEVKLETSVVPSASYKKERQTRGQTAKVQQKPDADVYAVISPKTQPIVHGLQSIIEFDWVTIPAGEFIMGSDALRYARDREKPQHRLNLAEYRIARVPVTNDQYKQFAVATGYRLPDHWQDGQIPSGKGNHPVVHVSWHDAITFCHWAGVRLPTEAEWEKAARGTDGRSWPWGIEPPNKNRCNFNGNVGDTTPVCAYSRGASPFGVLDMLGNVWEWTNSLYKIYPYKPDDGREDLAAAGRRVLRGGSFVRYQSVPHCALRSHHEPDYHFYSVGFRVVRYETTRES